MNKTPKKKNAKITKTRVIEEITPKLRPKAAAAMRDRLHKPVEPDSEDPIAELREVVRQHKFLTNFATRTTAPLKDRKIHETGEVLPTRATPDLITDGLAAAETAKKGATQLESRMRRLLRGVPIYDEFLKHVDGCGAVVAAYLVTSVRIERVEKVSQLIRYCGFACGADGKSERRSTGPLWQPDGTFKADAGGTPNQELKIRIVQMFCLGIRMHCCKGGELTKPNKYMQRWLEAKHAALTIPNPRLGRLMRDGEADSKGRRKATDLFLWDLYVMWRTLAGLPIRADKYSAVRGRYHNGQQAGEQPYMLTLDEARELAGVGPSKAEAAAE